MLDLRAGGSRLAFQLLVIRTALEKEEWGAVSTELRALLTDAPAEAHMWRVLFASAARAHTSELHAKIGMRWMVRLLGKHPECRPVIMAIAHNCMLVASNELALGEYARLLPEGAYVGERLPLPASGGAQGSARGPRAEPLVCLCLGVCFLSQVVKRVTVDAHVMAAHAFSWLSEYADQRGHNQEACYNLGRAMHQLGAYEFARLCYERALAKPGELRREAAYNLSLIYRQSGSVALAHAVLREHLTI